MLKSLFRRLSTPSLAPVDWGQHPVANLTTPDAIIVAHLIQTFTADFEDWTNEDFRKLGNPDFRYETVRPKLINTKLKVEISFPVVYQGTGLKRSYVISGNGRFKRFSSNGFTATADFQLDTTSSEALLKTWTDISTKMKAAKETAAKALAEMKANEEKWNVAESLLGMKRNATGLLMPIETEQQKADKAWDACDCDLGQACSGCAPSAPTPAPDGLSARKPRKRKEKPGETALVPLDA
jgi:hypothetical protein